MVAEICFFVFFFVIAGTFQDSRFFNGIHQDSSSSNGIHHCEGSRCALQQTCGNTRANASATPWQGPCNRLAIFLCLFWVFSAARPPSPVAEIGQKHSLLQVPDLTPKQCEGLERFCFAPWTESLNS